DHRASHELVRETAGGRGAGELLDEAVAGRLLDRGDELGRGRVQRRCQYANLELRAGHGGELERRDGVAAETRETAADERATPLEAGELCGRPDEADARLRDVEVAAVEQGPPELAHEQRRAVRQLPHGGDELVRRLGVGRVANERAHLLFIEVAEREPR